MKHRKLIWGTLLLASANFITKCMGFYNRIFLSAQIGAEGNGLYQLILPLYALTWSITSAGLTTTISRLTAQENMRQESGNIGRLVKQSVCISFCILFLLLVPGTGRIHSPAHCVGYPAPRLPTGCARQHKAVFEFIRCSSGFHRGPRPLPGPG